MKNQVTEQKAKFPGQFDGGIAHYFLNRGPFRFA